MRSIILVTICSLLLAGCGTTPNQSEATASASAQTNAVPTKVCKEKPAQTGSRIAKKVCK
jgi:uncharacterized protein YceK